MNSLFFFKHFRILWILISLMLINSIHGCGSEYNDFLQTNSSEKNVDLIRAGFLAQYDDIVYFINYEDNGKLYSIKANGQNYSRVLNEKGHFLSIVNGWVYYTGDFMDGYKLYRIRMDGSEKVLVSREDFRYSCIYGSLVYYVHTINTADEMDKTELFKMNLDGTGNTKIAESVLSPIVEDDTIYYINPDDDKKIYCMGLDGLNKKKLCDYNTSSMVLSDAWIYFVGIDNSSSLFRIRKDGMLLEKIADIPEDSSLLNVYDNYIYFEDGRKGLYCIDINSQDKKLVCYIWNTPVKNMDSWGIDPVNTGAVIENFGGFVPLYKALDYIVSYEVPGFRLASSYGTNINIKISDMMDKSEVQELKQRFNDIIYIYPSGLYLDEKIVQGRLALGVKTVEDKYLYSILEYLSLAFAVRPMVVVFTILEEGRNVSIDSIGYISEDSIYIERINGDYKTSFDEVLSLELSDTLLEWSYVQDASLNNKSGSDGLQQKCIYLNAGFGEFSKMYTAEAGIYLPERISRDKRVELLERLANKISEEYKNPWFCMVVYYCEKGQGDLMYREALAMGYKLPQDKSVRIVFNSSQ